MKLLRYAMGFVDQAVLSLASLMFIVVAAQFLAPSDLGEFVLGLSTIVLVQSLTRALSGETLLVRSTHAGFARNEVSASAGLSALIAVLSGLGCLVLTAVVPGKASFFTVLAVGIVGLLVHDAVRFAALALGSSARLLLVDGVYALSSTALMYWAGSVGAGASGMLLAIGVVGCLVGVIAAIALRVRPCIGIALPWVRNNWRLTSSLFAEAGLGAILGYSISLILVIFVSSSELAAYRSALSIFGLTSLAINFLRTVVLRDLRIDGLRTSSMLWAKGGVMAALVVCAVGLTYILLLLVPENLGKLFFGDTWSLMALIFLAAAVNRTMAGLSIIPTLFLRVQGVTWRATSTRIAITLLGFGLGPVGAWLAGAPGALLAEAIAYLVLTVALMGLSQRVARALSGRRRGRRRASRRVRVRDGRRIFKTLSVKEVGKPAGNSNSEVN